MDLRPSHGVGPFELGATLFAVLNLLRASRLAFPSVKVAFSTEVSAPRRVPNRPC